MHHGWEYSVHGMPPFLGDTTTFISHFVGLLAVFFSNGDTEKAKCVSGDNHSECCVFDAYC